MKLGDQFPPGRLTSDGKKNINTIVVFTPSLEYDNEYASMMTQGFYYYFDQRLAFPNESFMYNPETRIVYIVRGKQDEPRSILNMMGSAKAIFDGEGELFKQFGIKEPTHISDDSTIVIVDKAGKVAYVDNAYRSQGEHLKPLENKTKELNGIKVATPSAVGIKQLKVGDTAPDFQLDEKEKLSDPKGSIVLVSFYPAAFSGTMRQPVVDVSNLTVTPGTMPFLRIESMSCAIQNDGIDKIGRTPKKTKKSEVRRVAISSSSRALLSS